MKQKTIVIVGGVAGGASAAARLRRLNEFDKIIMLEKGEYISFANCGLPYYLGDVITDRNKLLVQTPAAMTARFNLDIRVQHEAIDLDHQNKQLTVFDHKTGTQYLLDYDVLVLSPGAKAFVPPVEGLEHYSQINNTLLNNVFTLRSMNDTDLIKQFISVSQPKNVAIIGAGFIGLEMAENMVHAGAHVTIVEASNQILAPLDSEMAAIVEKHIIAQGITLFKNDGLAKVSDNGHKIHLNSGKVIETDMIIISIGVAPDTKWLEKQPLQFGQRNSLVVNSKLQTNLPDVYAVGDAIEVIDYVNKQPTYVPLAWPANRQGRLVADIISGRDVQYNGTMGTSVAKIFDLTAASTGNNEKTLQRMGTPFQAVHTHSNSHAGYYPGASMIALKLLFSPNDGTILGVQAVGKSGVDKRVDVLATAIKSGLKVYDLADLELCYAPPYSSAKDPVNMLGYVATNIFDGDVDTIQWHEIDDFVKQGGLLIDVRGEDEVAGGAIKGSINIPLPQLRARLAEIPKDHTIAVTCKIGLRGYVAARILQQYGYKVINLDGGYATYSAVF